MTRLLLVRHGETTWNAEGRIQGHMNSDLSPLGRAQAEVLKHRLKRIHPAAIYSSDLSRAMETIRPTAELLGVPVVPRTDLREKCFGEWEGLSPADVEERYPGEWSRYRSHFNLDYEIPGGETWDEVRIRVETACRYILQQHDAGDTVIITGHGGSLRPIILYALRAPMSCLYHMSVDNAGVTCLDFKSTDEGRVVYLNDTLHLVDLVNPETLVA